MARCILDLKEYAKHGLKFRFVLDDAAFNRFDHSIGTGCKKSQLLISMLSKNIPKDYSGDNYRKFFDDEFKKIQKKIGQIDKTDLIAEEIISYMHDCMHLPFSHLFESAIIKNIGFHESLVKKSLLEDVTIKKYLKRISPNLCKVIKKHLNKNPFSTLNASSFDLDRFDYILRGAYFKDTSLDCTNFPSFFFEEIEINGIKEIVPVYDEDEYDNIINILKYRADLYTGELGYLSPQVILADAVFGVVLNKLLKDSGNCENSNNSSKTKSFKKLKKFIDSISPKPTRQNIEAKDIKIKEVLKWDNVNLINSILDYAESLDEKNDSETIKLIALMLPSLKSLMYMTSYMKYEDNITNPKKEDKKSIKDYIKKRKKEDKILINRLRKYITSDTLLARCLRDENFFFDNIEYVQNPDEEALKNVDDISTFYEQRTFKEYGEPIYIKLKNGKICPINEVPNKTFPFSSDVKEFNFVFNIKMLCQEKGISSSNKKNNDTSETIQIPQGRFSYKVQENFSGAIIEERAS